MSKIFKDYNELEEDISKKDIKSKQNSTYKDDDSDLNINIELMNSFINSSPKELEPNVNKEKNSNSEVIENIKDEEQNNEFSNEEYNDNYEDEEEININFPNNGNRNFNYENTDNNINDEIIEIQLEEEHIEDNLQTKDNEDDIALANENSSDIVIDDEKLTKIISNVLKNTDDISLKEENNNNLIEEKRKKALDDISTKYNLNTQRVEEIIKEYEKFSIDLKELERQKVDKEYIKNALLEKKKKEEDSKLALGIEKLLKNVIKDIKTDTLLESVDKYSIYEKNFLPHIKKSLLSYIDEVSKDDKKNFLDKEELFKLFSKHYGVKTLEYDINVFLSLFLGKNSLENFLYFISSILSNDKFRQDLEEMEKELKQVNFSIDTVYYI